jgi:hypothetical protein
MPKIEVHFRRLALWMMLMVLWTYLPKLARADSSTANLSVAVSDSSGAVIPGAHLLLRNSDTNQEQQADSGNAGSTTFSFLKPGHYSLTVSKNAFADVFVDHIVLNVGDDKRLLLLLKVGSAAQTVNVDGSGLSINTTDASVSTVVDRRFVENMPLNGRSFQDLISMTPGIVTQNPQSGGSVQGVGDFSVNGQRTQSNYYTVDGVSGNVAAGSSSGFGQAASSGSIASSTALGTTQSLVSVDALQEFKVSSSTYSAEYGRTPGGQFSLSTRSGTNDVHGTVFDYLRNDFFDANDWFNKQNGLKKTTLRQNDFGGTVGGPIVMPRLYNARNKSFFFGSYEGLRLTQPTAATTQYVPVSAIRTGSAAAAQPVFNAFPLPTGNEISVSGSPSGLAPFVSAYSLPGKIDSTSVRLDQRLTDKLTVFFRFADTPTFTETRTLSLLSTRHYDTKTYTLGATAQLTHKISNELRFGYADSASTLNSIIDNFGGATPTDLRSAMAIPGNVASSEAQVSIYIPSVALTSIDQRRSSNHVSQWNLTDMMNISLGHHQLRIGIDQRRIHTPLSPATPYLGMSFDSRASMIANLAYSASVQTLRPSEPIFNEFSAFVQDEWRISPSLALSAGIRWEVNPPPTEANGNVAYTVLGNVNVPSTLTLAPHGTPLWNTTWYNFAPRLGLAWTAHSEPGRETVLRAGGGVFYDTGNQQAALGYSAVGFLGFKTYTNVSVPIASAVFNLSTDPTFPISGVYAYPAHMQLPYTLQWNVSLEQALGRSQTFSLSYVASSGRRLLQQQRHVISSLNPNFQTLYYFPGGLTSSYQSLQLKFQRSVAHGLQALSSYTWSHALDYGSTDSSYQAVYGNSDFDVRHNLQAGLTWDMPHSSGNTVLSHVTSGWGLDGRVIARSAFPITLTGNLITDSTGSSYYSGVNFDASKPIYLYGTQYPGGRAINGNPNNTVNPAFTLPTGADMGNAPRNFVRAFDAVQLNLAARRDFALTEQVHLQFCTETFNLLNHPIFGYVNPTLSSVQFGQATKMLNQSLGSLSSLYQQGGPRSMQFTLRVSF